MQRSLSHQKSLTPFVYVALFVIYEGLSSIHLFLPPLLGVLFLLFINSLKNDDSLYTFLIVFCLMVFELEKGYNLFSVIVYFALIYRFVLPKLEVNFSCSPCIKISVVLLAYIGFYFFGVMLSSIFLTEMPSINYYVIFYIVIEFLIVSIL